VRANEFGIAGGVPGFAFPAHTFGTHPEQRNGDLRIPAAGRPASQTASCAAVFVRPARRGLARVSRRRRTRRTHAKVASADTRAVARAGPIVDRLGQEGAGQRRMVRCVGFAFCKWFGDGGFAGMCVEEGSDMCDSPIWQDDVADFGTNCRNPRRFERR